MPIKPTLVINAGGQSRRMGESKALMAVPPDNQPLIRHIMQRLEPLFVGNIVARRLVIANDPTIQAEAGLPKDVSYFQDIYSDAGVLGGIATALAQCEGWALFVACDMPFLNAKLLAHLCKLTTDDDCKDAIVPVVDGYEQTMHALYHRRCLPAIEARLANNQRRIVSFFDDVNVYRVPEDDIRSFDPEFHSFMNVNTPEEWRAALEILNE